MNEKLMVLRSSRHAVCLIAALIVAFVGAPALRAQDYPIVDAYVSFAVANTDYGSSRFNSPGLQLSIGYNPHTFVRLTGEFSANFHSTDLVWQNPFDFRQQTMKLHDYRLLFGPEFVFRNRSRVTPFVRAMAGYAIRHYNVGTGIIECSYTSWYQQDCEEKQQTVVGESGFAAQFGGGLDISLHPVVSLRAVQFDYIRTNRSRDATPLVPDPSILPSLAKWQSEYRFAVGIVFNIPPSGERRRK